MNLKELWRHRSRLIGYPRLDPLSVGVRNLRTSLDLCLLWIWRNNFLHFQTFRLLRQSSLLLDLNLLVFAIVIQHDHHLRHSLEMSLPDCLANCIPSWSLDHPNQFGDIKTIFRGDVEDVLVGGDGERGGDEDGEAGRRGKQDRDVDCQERGVGFWEMSTCKPDSIELVIDRCDPVVRLTGDITLSILTLNHLHTLQIPLIPTPLAFSSSFNTTTLSSKKTLTFKSVSSIPLGKASMHSERSCLSEEEGVGLGWRSCVLNCAKGGVERKNWM